jgi:hypothetical protein
VTHAPSTPPASFTPPAGLCRLWIDGVPASQQPAPTDCAIAIKNRPANATVVFGPQRRTTGNELGFTRGSGMPMVRQLAPNALRARGHDEARDHPADTTAKGTVRKPEKPQ